MSNENNDDKKWYEKKGWSIAIFFGSLITLIAMIGILYHFSMFSKNQGFSNSTTWDSAMDLFQ